MVGRREGNAGQENKIVAFASNYSLFLIKKRAITFFANNLGGRFCKMIYF